MNKGRILITVDHKWRDLPSYVYLSYLLEKKGFETMLVRNYEELTCWKSFNPDIIILNHAIEERRRRWIESLPENIRVIILPTEGLPVEKKNFEVLIGESRSWYKRIDRVYSWFISLYDFWKPEFALSKENIVISGIPRFDFIFDKKLYEIFKKGRDIKRYLGINENSKVITFFLNFANAATYENNLEGWKKILKDQGYEVDKYIKIAESDFKARENFLKTLNYLSEEFKNITFVVKPHPNEDFHFYSKNISNENVVLVGSYYSYEIIDISDLTIQRTCTTGLEAEVMGKKCIEYNYGLPEAYKGDVFNGMWPEAKNDVHLTELISFFINENYEEWDRLKNRRREILDKYICYNAGKATEFIVEDLEKILKKKNKNIYKSQIGILKFYTILILKDFYRSIKKDNLGRFDKVPKLSDFIKWKRKIIKIYG